MENNKFEAVIAFDAAVKNLQDFCEENTDFNVVLMSNEYPFRVQFIPCDPAQTTMFETNNISEDGEVNDLVVTVEGFALPTKCPACGAKEGGAGNG